MMDSFGKVGIHENIRYEESEGKGEVRQKKSKRGSRTEKACKVRRKKKKVKEREQENNMRKKNHIQV